MSLGKDKYYSAEGGFEEGEALNTQGKYGKYVYNKEELAEICNLDNHHVAGNAAFPQMRLSSQMIMEKYGGPNGIMSALYTNIKTGIDNTDEDKKDRIRIYGENKFAPPKIKTIMELIMENFEDTINRVLLGAAVVSLIIGIYQEGFPKGLIEGTSIMIALCIIITVTSVNNYISEKRLAELVALSNVQEVAVLRGDDKAQTIDATDLVVGDLVKFSMGEKVPADMIMVEGQDVSTNEAELTGEPDSLEKMPVTQDNYKHGAMCTMLAKSLVDGGIGKAIVMAVGPATVAGVITEKTQTAGEMTLLQVKLDKMAGKIGNIGLACAVATILSCVIRILIEMLGGLPCQCQNIFVCQKVEGCEAYDFASLDNRVYTELLESVIIGITVVVVAIPEGLPLAVTISLSFSSAKMQKLNNLVRKIASSETMGGATHICSDKTGTLTENKMTVMGAYAIEKCLMAEGDSIDAGLAKKGESAFQQVQVQGQSVWDTLVDGVLWNSSAWIEKDEEVGDFVTKGNVTEQGIIKYFMNSSMAVDGCLAKKADLTDAMTLCIIPFTSRRKMGSIVVRNAQQTGTDREVRVYTKGAPDMLLEKVTRVITQDGQVVNVDNTTTVPEDLLLPGEQSGTQDSYRNFFERCVKKFAKEAFRTLLITYKDMSMNEFKNLKQMNNDFQKEADRLVLETDLVAAGLFGLQDPLRSTIKSSIAQCHNAGIQVIMCTGDNIDTATAISRNAGIVNDEEIANNEYSCMTGKQFREKVGGLKKITVMKKGVETEVDVVGDMQAFKEVKEQLKVLARSSPEDKYILVTGIQDSMGVVAVTGDGTNDAPALTKADVGFAMGITGTDVAKGASDIILLDDNFSSIIVALKYGRNVYDNVRKFLQFQLTVNFVAMGIVFTGAVITKKTPLNAVQMLWVNLIMDTFAALALATEPPPADILDRQPYKKDNPIITGIMARNVFGHTIYQAIVLLVLLFAGPAMLTDYSYELQCVKYNADSTCDKTGGFNPYYTNGEYYNPELWKSFTETTGEFITKTDKWEPFLLHLWQCNIYGQEFPTEGDKMIASDLCSLGLTMKTYTPAARLAAIGKLNAKDKATYEKFATSKFAKINPATRKPTNAEDISSDGYNTEETKLFSFVFNAFVFMQVFNQLNARKLEDGEFNPFSGILSNIPFIGIVLLTIIVQLAMVEFGGKMVKCWPLNMHQNMICVLIGFIELPWGLFIKFLPVRFFDCLSLEDKDDDDEGEGKIYLSQAIKGSKSKKVDASIN